MWNRTKHERVLLLVDFWHVRPPSSGDTINTDMMVMDGFDPLTRPSSPPRSPIPFHLFSPRSSPGSGRPSSTCLISRGSRAGWRGPPPAPAPGQGQGVGPRRSSECVVVGRCMYINASNEMKKKEHNRTWSGAFCLFDPIDCFFPLSILSHTPHHQNQSHVFIYIYTSICPNPAFHLPDSGGSGWNAQSPREANSPGRVAAKWARAAATT